MSDPIENVKDGTSGGEFDSSLHNLIDAIPKDRGEDIDSKDDDQDQDDPLNGDKDDTKTDDADDADANADDVDDSKDQDSGDDGDDDGEGSPIIDDLASEFGDVDFGDEVEFESEAQAAKVYVKKLLETKSKEISKEAIETLFANMPAVGALANHLAEGYGLDSFLKDSQPKDFKPIDLEEASDDTKEAIISRAYKMRGLDDEEIADSIEIAKDTGKLNQRAERAQEYLKKRHEDEVNKIKEAEKVENAKRQQEAEETNKKIKTILDDGKLLGGQITLDREKTKVIETFIASGDKRAEAYQKLDLDKMLLLDYLVATDFKDVNFGTATKQKSTLSKNIRIKNTKTTRVNMSKGGKKESSGSPFDVKDFLNNANQ